MNLLQKADLSPDAVATRIRELGDWFHNMDLAGVMTAPHHFLGDYPTCKWRRFAHAIPQSLKGKTVLDVGCNAGFYALQMKERGAARVVAIDEDEGYLEQARFAAQVYGADIEFHQMSVYDVSELGERFDLVIFMGVLYHLRHPLLALDLLSEHVVGDLFLFQSMLRGSAALEPVAPDYPFEEAAHFDAPAYPKLHFVEQRYARDPTNWWIPNKSCVEAMLRSSGFSISCNPEPEVYLCRVDASARSRQGIDSTGAADLAGLRA
jgi:tRNA (mo5U34)-methyltransferase